MKAIKFFLLIVLISSTSIYSQNEIDALRYSYLIHGGTARYNAMGGAFSSLGADFSTLSSNPAGIGVFKSSEWVFTPSVSYEKISSKYMNIQKEDFKYNFNFQNFGVIVSGDISSSDEQVEWKNIQVGFGVNRLQSFNGRAIMEGMNKTSTILDVYSNYAQGIRYDKLHPFDTQLAFNTYLIDTVGSPTNYTQAFYGGALQKKSILTSGGVNEMVVTLGGNYNDKFYIGGTLGFPFVNYEELSSYKEIDADETISNFNSLTINDDLSTIGSGFNFKFGIIYRIADWIRISGAFHTPTFYSLTDTYSRKIESDLESKGSYSDASPSGRYEYKLMTPMRTMGGLAFVFAPYGTISAEYELVDYSSSRLREKSVIGTFDTQNEAINEKYTTTGNIRLGTEWVLAPFCFRAGYAIYGSPYKSDLNDASINIVSGGVGIKEKNYFIDFTYVRAVKNENYYLYPIPASTVISPVEMSSDRNQFVLTLGIRF